MPFNRNSKGNNGGSVFHKQPATEKYKDWTYTKLKVTASVAQPTLKNPNPDSVVFNIYNLNPDDAKAIVERLTTMPNKKTETAWVNRNNDTNVCIRVKKSDIKEWLDGGDLNSIQAVLYKSGNVPNDEIANLEHEFGQGVEYSEGFANREADFQKSEESVNDMWERYLTTINDPVTLKQLELYNRMYTKLGFGAFGHILSMRNVDLIRAKKPDAVFVTTKKNWAEQFHRGIKRGATPIPYYTPGRGGDASKQAFDKAKQDNGWGDVADSDLSVQVKKELNILAGGSDLGGVIKNIGYDYSDTYQFNENEADIFSSQIGLANNLTGELNKLAAAKKAEVEKSAADMGKIDGQDEMEKRTQMGYEYFKDHAEELGISAPAPTSTNTTAVDYSNGLARMVVEYCKNKATEKANVLSANKIQTYGETAAKAALVLTRLALPAVSKMTPSLTFDNRKERAGVIAIMYDIVRLLENNTTTTLEEGLLSWLQDKKEFAKRAIRVLKQIGCKFNFGNEDSGNGGNEEVMTPEVVKENFNKIFNKINKNYF